MKTVNHYPLVRFVITVPGIAALLGLSLTLSSAALAQTSDPGSRAQRLATQLPLNPPRWTAAPEECIASVSIPQTSSRAIPFRPTLHVDRRNPPLVLQATRLQKPKPADWHPAVVASRTASRGR